MLISHVGDMKPCKTRAPVWSSGYGAFLTRHNCVQYLGATLGGQAGHYSTPAVKWMSWGVKRATTTWQNINNGRQPLQDPLRRVPKLAQTQPRHELQNKQGPLELQQ